MKIKFYIVFVVLLGILISVVLKNNITKVYALDLVEDNDVVIRATVENIPHIEATTTFDVDKTEIYTDDRIIVTLYASSNSDPLVGYRWRVNLSPNDLCVFIYQQLVTDINGQAIALIECREPGTVLIDVSIILSDGTFVDLAKVVAVTIIERPYIEPEEPIIPVEPEEPVIPEEPEEPEEPIIPREPEDPPSDISDEKQSLWDIIKDFYDGLPNDVKWVIENFHRPLTIISILLSLSNFNIWTTILHLINTIANFLGVTKSKRMGVVYDSVTKQPVSRAVVRMVDVKTNKLIRTSVSDNLGYFWTPDEDITVKVSVQRPGYVFPSAIVVGKEDKPYVRIVRDVVEDLSVPFNIPIDPVNKASGRYRLLALAKVTLRFLNGLLLIFLTLVSGFMYLRYGWILSFVSMVLGVFMMLIQIYDRISISTLSRFGTVFYNDGTVASNVSIDLIDKQFNQLVQRRVTNSKGKYLLYVPNGEFVIKCTYANGAKSEEVANVANDKKKEKFYRENFVLKTN